MENVKYRAWDKVNEKMITHGQLFRLDTSNEEPFLPLLETFKDRYILMQYSCLNDMNGKEIYEDDVFLIDHGGGHSWTERVIFHLGCFMAGDDNILGTEAIHLSGRVIGNIHQNLELDPRNQDVNPHHRRNN